MPEEIVPVGPGRGSATVRSKRIVAIAALALILLLPAGLLAVWYASAPIPSGLYPAHQYMHITRDWCDEQFELKLLWVKPTPFAIRPPVVRRAELLDRNMNLVLSTPVALRPAQSTLSSWRRGVEMKLGMPMGALAAAPEPAVYVRLTVDGMEPATYSVGEIRFAPATMPSAYDSLGLSYYGDRSGTSFGFGFAASTGANECTISRVDFVSGILPPNFASQATPKVIIAPDTGGVADEEIAWQLPLKLPAHSYVRVIWTVPDSAAQAIRNAYWRCLPVVTTTDGVRETVARYNGWSDWSVGVDAWKYYVTVPEGGR